MKNYLNVWFLSVLVFCNWY